MLVPSCNSSAQISCKLGEGDAGTNLDQDGGSNRNDYYNVSAAGAQESVILELHDVRATRWLQWENGKSGLDNGVGMMGTLLQRHRHILCIE